MDGPVELCYFPLLDSQLILGMSADALLRSVNFFLYVDLVFVVLSVAFVLRCVAVGFVFVLRCAALRYDAVLCYIVELHVALEYVALLSCDLLCLYCMALCCILLCRAV